jgi:hypothetical protein
MATRTRHLPSQAIAAGPIYDEKETILQIYRLVTGHKFRLLQVDSENKIFDIIGVRPNGTCTPRLFQAAFQQPLDTTTKPPNPCVDTLISMIEEKDIDIFYAQYPIRKTCTVLVDPEQLIYFPPMRIMQ